jgi:hypothetical protein
MDSIPQCPTHGAMIKTAITQGEGKDEKFLGWMWMCPEKECDNCEDCNDPAPEKVGQMELFGEL